MILHCYPIICPIKKKKHPFGTMYINKDNFRMTSGSQVELSLIFQELRTQDGAAMEPHFFYGINFDMNGMNIEVS